MEGDGAGRVPAPDGGREVALESTGGQGLALFAALVQDRAISLLQNTTLTGYVRRANPHRSHRSQEAMIFIAFVLFFQ